MSSRRAWCQSRLNSSCSTASPSVRLNISLRRWTPRTVCTARLGRPLSAQYIGAKSSSSIRGSASFRKTSAHLPSRRLAFFGVTRNWDCQRLLLRVSRSEHAPLPRPGAAPTPFPHIILPLPRRTRVFTRESNIPPSFPDQDLTAMDVQAAQTRKVAGEHACGHQYRRSRCSQ